MTGMQAYWIITVLLILVLLVFTFQGKYYLRQGRNDLGFQQPLILSVIGFAPAVAAFFVGQYFSKPMYLLALCSGFIFFCSLIGQRAALTLVQNPKLRTLSMLVILCNAGVLMWLLWILWPLQSMTTMLG